MALGVHSSAAVPRPAASSFMPLRCARQAPGLRKGCVCGGGALTKLATLDQVSIRDAGRTSHIHESRSAVYSAQRHKGGGSGPRPQRGTAAELSTPSASSRTRASHGAPPARSRTRASHGAPPARSRARARQATLRANKTPIGHREASVKPQQAASMSGAHLPSPRHWRTYCICSARAPSVRRFSGCPPCIRSALESQLHQRSCPPNHPLLE
jgi:hypothetical protein